MSTPTRSRFAPLFVPNLIGYGRLVCLIIAVATAFEHPWLAAVCMCLCIWGDFFDGRIARKLGQTSAFGQLLDFITDHYVLNLAMYLILCRLYPQWWLAVLFVAVADGSAHAGWTYLALLRGSSSHRSSAFTKVRLIELYYRGPVLSVTVGFYQFTMLALYCAAQIPDLHQLWLALLLVFAPGFLFKLAVHCVKVYLCFFELRFESVREEELV